MSVKNVKFLSVAHLFYLPNKSFTYFFPYTPVYYDIRTTSLCKLFTYIYNKYQFHMHKNINKFYQMQVHFLHIQIYT